LSCIRSFIYHSVNLISNPEYSSIWQSLIDITSDILNSYGSLHSTNDSSTYDLFFKPLLQVNRRNQTKRLYYVVVLLCQKRKSIVKNIRICINLSNVF